MKKSVEKQPDLYFIAIVPPIEIQGEITKLKQLCAQRYGSKHALKSPPHITLHMPFKWKENRFGELENVIQQLNQQMTPFEVQLKGFSFFEPRVIFVDVVKNELLTLLQKEVVTNCRRQLNLDNGNFKNRPFHPHVTIAFRDLKKPLFYEAKKEFEKREVNFNFQVDQIALLKHDGEKWDVMNF